MTTVQIVNDTVGAAAAHAGLSPIDNKTPDIAQFNVSTKEIVPSDNESETASTPPSSKPSNADISTKVLKVIESYGLNFERTGSWDGFSTFLPIVEKYVENGEAVRLLLPGFPFKSPNSKDKVLGCLPDMGEEIALKHLNGLCENIAQVYDKGAEVHICSDGLVYNDLLGVSDETVWNYGEEVRAISAENDLNHIKFIRLHHLLDHPGAWDEKDYYVTNAPCIRREMLTRFRDVQFEEDMANKSDSDMQMTHASYLKYLEKDLALHAEYQVLSDEDKKKDIAQRAKNMMGRWKAYAAALEASRQGFVRLSIHDSGGSGKLSMSLIPQAKGELGKTPWHSVLAVEEDGSYSTHLAADLHDNDKYTLVHRRGRPYYYRVKSPLFDWSEEGLDVECHHQYPCGLIITPSDTSNSPSIRSLPMQKVRALSNNFSPVVLRGFTETTTQELFIEKAHELGQVLVWPQYGVMAKVKDAGKNDKDANNVTSNEAMPMHFDGIFKYKDVTDPDTGITKQVLNPPAYQYFTCIATAPRGSGYTLFARSKLFFRYLSAPWSVERMEPVTWGTLNTGFWKRTQEELSLVVRHPVTNEPCLRWHEPWTDTKFSTCKVVIENEEQSLIGVVNKGIYDWRSCLRFSWEKGDLLINDNTAMLHTRTAYEADCDREMWRIHFD